MTERPVDCRFLTVFSLGSVWGLSLEPLVRLCFLVAGSVCRIAGVFVEQKRICSGSSTLGCLVRGLYAMSFVCGLCSERCEGVCRWLSRTLYNG